MTESAGILALGTVTFARTVKRVLRGTTHEVRHARELSIQFFLAPWRPQFVVIEVSRRQDFYIAILEQLRRMKPNPIIIAVRPFQMVAGETIAGADADLVKTNLRRHLRPLLKFLSATEDLPPISRTGRVLFGSPRLRAGEHYAWFANVQDHGILRSLRRLLTDGAATVVVGPRSTCSLLTTKIDRRNQKSRDIASVRSRLLTIPALANVALRAADFLKAQSRPVVIVNATSTNSDGNEAYTTERLLSRLCRGAAVVVVCIYLLKSAEHFERALRCHARVIIGGHLLSSPF
jgi:hypothetical protein